MTPEQRQRAEMLAAPISSAWSQTELERECLLLRELLAQDGDDSIDAVATVTVYEGFSTWHIDRHKMLPAGEHKLYTHSTSPQKPLTEGEIVRIIIESNGLGAVKLTYDSGPYEITRPTVLAQKLVAAVERAHGIGGKA